MIWKSLLGEGTKFEGKSFFISYSLKLVFKFLNTKIFFTCHFHIHLLQFNMTVIFGCFSWKLSRLASHSQKKSNLINNDGKQIHFQQEIIQQEYLGKNGLLFLSPLWNKRAYIILLLIWLSLLFTCSTQILI